MMIGEFAAMPRTEEQVVRVLDVRLGAGAESWRRGLNNLPRWFDDEIMAWHMQRELDASGLHIDTLPDGTLALFTDTTRREGDEICLVNGLLYDSIAGLTTFLGSVGDDVWLNKLLAIHGLGLAGNDVGTLYMALTGAARNIRQYSDSFVL